MQIRAEIYKAKLELLFKLERMPTEKEITDRVGISPERYHEVMRASKPIISLNSKHSATQEEFINVITDVDGVDGDKRRQPALLRLALDDVVIFFLHVNTCLDVCHFVFTYTRHIYIYSAHVKTDC